MTSGGTEVTLASRVRINDDVMFQELQGEAVLLSLASGTYFGLDRMGTRIWQLFSEHEQLSRSSGSSSTNTTWTKTAAPLTW